jgi:hypothetical protein
MPRLRSALLACIDDRSCCSCQSRQFPYHDRVAGSRYGLNLQSSLVFVVDLVMVERLELTDYGWMGDGSRFRCGVLTVRTGIGLPRAAAQCSHGSWESRAGIALTCSRLFPPADSYPIDTPLYAHYPLVRGAWRTKSFAKPTVIAYPNANGEPASSPHARLDFHSSCVTDDGGRTANAWTVWSSKTRGRVFVGCCPIDRSTRIWSHAWMDAGFEAHLVAVDKPERAVYTTPGKVWPVQNI